MAWLWWLGAALVLGVIEMLTLSFFFLMLALGALAGVLAALLGAPFWAQVVTVGVVSVVLLFAVRPWAKELLDRTAPQVHTNVGAHVGREAVAVSEVTAHAGRVRLMGEVWSARTESAVPLAEGTRVRVVRIEGATAVVEPVIDLQSHSPYPNLGG